MQYASVRPILVVRIVDFSLSLCIVHFWLHHTAHCAEKMVSAHLHAGSASAERVGQGKWVG